MFGPRKVDVLIVGAGPVGMTTALMLNQRGLDVQVIDKSPGPCTHSNAMALAPSSLSLLSELGCLDALLEQGFKIERVDFFGEGRIRGSVELQWLDTKHPYALCVPQSVLENVLEDALAERHCPVLWNHRAAELSEEGERVRLLVDRMEQRMMGYAVMHEEWLVDKSFPFSAKWLIAADGYDSLIRRLMHVPYEQVGPSRSYILAEHETAGMHDPVIRVHYQQEEADECLGAAIKNAGALCHGDAGHAF